MAVRKNSAYRVKQAAPPKSPARAIAGFATITGLLGLGFRWMAWLSAVNSANRPESRAVKTSNGIGLYSVRK